MTKTTSKTKAPKVMPGKVKIEWGRSCSSLSQIYDAGLEYCFISKDNKQCCPFVLCKDFLQDALMATHQNKSVKIYGFNFDPTKREPIHLARLRIAITNSKDKNFGDKIPKMLDFIHQFEKKLRLIRTRVRAVANPRKKYSTCGVYLLEGSNRWLVSPPMLSMYTLLLRIGFVHKLGSSFQKTLDNVTSGDVSGCQTDDPFQLSNARTGIERVLKHGYAKIFFKEPKKNYPNIGVHCMHNNMGICAFSANSSRSHVKHWHRDITKKKKTAKKGAKK